MPTPNPHAICTTENCEHEQLPHWDRCFCCVMAPLAVSCGSNQRLPVRRYHDRPRVADIPLNTLRLMRNTERTAPVSHSW